MNGNGYIYVYMSQTCLFCKIRWQLVNNIKRMKETELKVQPKNNWKLKAVKTFFSELENILNGCQERTKDYFFLKKEI